MCSMITVVSGNDQREGSVVAVLESMGSKGSVVVNGTLVKKSTSCMLNSGDEVVFGLLGNHSYVSFLFFLHLNMVLVFLHYCSFLKENNQNFLFAYMY